MEWTEIMQFISQLGAGIAFPMFVCIFLIKYLNESQAKMNEAINNLEKALIKLSEKIDMLERKE